ncbi:MAG: hypothetical protein QGI83_23990 [Candidatus Latescibacteria bacterium]|jgi:hypothetical protein|nr:hypothetical protein [Candidatus Latescibacterota bacterium]
MRFGIGRRDITPPFYTHMHGYAGRKDTYDRINDPLTLTAVVLEEGKNRALLAAADICTFPNDGTLSELLAKVGKAVGCAPDNVMLNASHTHGGPRLPSPSLYWAGFRASTADQYRDFLYCEVLEAANEAVDNLADGSLWFGEGKTQLPMNRRPEREGGVANAPNPGGPVDNRLHLLALKKATGELAGVGMRISCHPVATGAQHAITADFPGAWRAAFSDTFGPDVVPFFLQGSGADARPHHVREEDHWRAMKHGELSVIGDELMAEMMAVLTSTALREVEDLTLIGKINVAHAPCEKRYTSRKQLKPLADAGGLQQQYAEACLGRLDRGEKIPDHVDFHVQTLWLNRELALIGLDVEPLCGLGSIVESAVAPKTGVLLGYNSGCIGYTPDSHEMMRGGYETNSYLPSVWCGPLLPGLERLFADAVVRRPPARRRGAKR